jgi:Na+-translocating ferredoxin:NAD+ oxidoreductase RnfC subunit
VAEAAVNIVSAVRDAGVAGMGGAGFPTHVKLGNEVDTLVANGAECEPIIECDKYLMKTAADRIVRGMELAMEHVSASRGVIALKRKNAAVVDVLERAAAANPAISVFPLGNYYPAGDELVLIRHVTGRMVEPGGLPFTAGVTVSNVATLAAVADAVDGVPVTSRMVTVAGEVARPVTLDVPLGTSMRELIAHAGGTTVPTYKIVAGGPIMGGIVSEDDLITKTVGGVIVLPADHDMIRIKQQEPRVTRLKAKMCCTCQECTILCPRNALGHPISPAKIMSYAWQLDAILDKIRSGNIDPFTERMVFEAYLCCQCGICEQFACIFQLSPNKVYAMVKQAIQEAGLKYDFSKMPTHDAAMFDYRHLSALTYARKLGLERYIVPTEFEQAQYTPQMVTIPLRQHIGAPSKPVVKQGGTVRTGDLIADIPEGALGARVHASIDGTVAAVTDTHIVVKGRGA